MEQEALTLRLVQMRDELIDETLRELAIEYVSNDALRRAHVLAEGSAPGIETRIAFLSFITKDQRFTSVFGSKAAQALRDAEEALGQPLEEGETEGTPIPLEELKAYIGGLRGTATVNLLRCTGLLTYEELIRRTGIELLQLGRRHVRHFGYRSLEKLRDFLIERGFNLADGQPGSI